MNKILSVFSLARLQESITIYRTLLTDNHTMEDLSDYLEEQYEEAEKLGRMKVTALSLKVAEWEAVAPLCPECKGYLNPPKHICKKEGPENLKGWTCLWFCNNGDCIYEKYTHEDAAEEMKKLMEKGRKE